MNFSEFWKSLPVTGRRALAEQCETSYGFMQNIAYGYRDCSPLLASLLEQATGGAVRRWDLRPIDWQKIWPELVSHPDAPPVPVETGAA